MSLRDHIAALPFVDTHSHMAGGDVGSPLNDRGGKSLPQILMSDHLRYLLEAQGQQTELFRRYRAWVPAQAEEHMAAVLPLLDRLRHLTAYAAVREGIRELYTFPEPDITADNWRTLNDRIVATYKQHGERAWQRAVARRARVVLANQMVVLPYVTDHWAALPPEDRAAQQRLLLPSLILDGYLFTGFTVARHSLRRSQELIGMEPKTYDEYLSFLGRVLDLFVEKGGRSVKLTTAYFRTLELKLTTQREATRLFAGHARSAGGEGLHRLQDNLLWHLLEMIHRRNLPLIVHTGYAVPPEWADPKHLLPVLRRYPDLKVDLCHSGWPNHGTALVLGREFRNCFFNLCWTPLLSRELGRRMLSEAIDMLPADKILIGTDTGTAEAFFGAVRLIRSVLTDVLEEKVSAGQFSVEVAKRLACGILLDNPLAFYGMREEDVPNLDAEPVASCTPTEVPLPFLDPEG